MLIYYTQPFHVIVSLHICVCIYKNSEQMKRKGETQRERWNFYLSFYHISTYLPVYASTYIIYIYIYIIHIYIIHIYIYIIYIYTYIKISVIKVTGKHAHIHRTT